MVFVSIGHQRVTPLTALAMILVMGGIGALLMPERGPERPCDPAVDRACAPGPGGVTSAPPLPRGPVLSSEEGCVNVGYLCAALDNADSIPIQRWREFSGTMVVFVPPPPVADPATARNLQRAASAGIRLWNGQPFPIVIDERGTREAHFRVQWALTLGATQLGIAHTEWSSAEGLRVRTIELAAQLPGRRRSLDPSQVRLTAAHEMGHALGLPHSDQPRDVMYPTNTASALTARDYRTLEALYALEDGTTIRR